MSILFVDYLIHILMFMLIVLMSINVFKIENAFFLIMKSIKLLISCIHFIFVIFRRSYDCRKLMTFIMKRFFCVISNFTRQSYNDFESMQILKIRNDRKSQTTLYWKQHRDRNRELMHTIQLREHFELRVCIWRTINERC